jgi:hypothetical protein
MVGVAAVAASECATLTLNACDACNNDACGQKVMAGAVVAAVTVAIMLLEQSTPLFLPL